MTFLAPIFLVGLAVLAVPVVLHLMRRQMPVRRVFPSIRFIRKGEHFHAGRRGLRDLITLFCRLLVLALIVMLFARPALRSLVDTPLQGGAVELVLFVDLSVSMHGIDFAAYRDDAIAAVMEQYPDARIGMVSSAHRLLEKWQVGTSRGELRTIAQGLEPTLYPGDHRAALAAASGMFVDASAAHILVIVSDLQQIDWASDRLPKLPSGVTVRWMPPDEQDTANVSVNDVTQEMFEYDGRRLLRAHVSVHNYGISPVETTVHIQAGSASASVSITIGGARTEKVMLELTDPDSQDAVAQVVHTEPYMVDNSFNFWAGPQPPRNLCLVANTADVAKGKGIELFFLRHALKLTLTGAVANRLEEKDPDFILDTDLQKYHTIILLDCAGNYTQAECRLLREFMDEGGQVVYFAGRDAADSISNLRSGGATTLRFLGYRKAEGDDLPIAIESMDASAAVMSVFQREESDLFMLPIYQIVRLHPGTETQVLLRTDGGDPFLTHESVGLGSFYAFAVSLFPTWSDFSTSLSFLPLLREIVAAGDRGARLPSLVVTEDYTAALKAAGVTVVGQTRISGPGAYMVGGIPVIVNVTRDESALRRAAERDVIDAFGLDTVAPSPGAPGMSGPEPPPRPLAGTVAWLLLTAFFLELVAANVRGGE